MKTLPANHKEELFRYIWGFIHNKQSILFQINGMEEHLHILCDIHPNIALTDFVRDLKTSTSKWLKENNHFSDFDGWASGYAALTYAYRDIDMIRNYIKRQEEHHQTRTFIEEYKALLVENGIKIDDRYFP